MAERGESGARAALDDVDLLGNAAAGDPDALAALYDRHSARMLGLALHLLGNRRDAEDLLHDVFLEVWKRAASYDAQRAGVRTWLLVKVRSRALDRLRSLGTARRHGMAGSAEVDGVEDLEADLAVLRGVDQSRALEALERLPDAQRDAVRLCYLEGWSCGEIAERCGLPVGTVKSRLARALALLREQLGAAGEDR
jgi:RNA polymerase sigma-70 factor, ECF subfamily